MLDAHTAAIMLTCMDEVRAAMLFENFSEEKQAKLAPLIAQGFTLSAQIVQGYADYLLRKIEEQAVATTERLGGIEHSVQMLNLMSRRSERNFIESLEKVDEDTAEEIKKRMFVFEDIVMLDDRAVQKVLRELDAHDVALSLKDACDEAKDKIFKNMSKNAAGMLKEDIEFLGAVRLKDVEEAQMKFVATIRRLEDAGEIVIARSGEEKIIL